MRLRVALALLLLAFPALYAASALGGSPAWSTAVLVLVGALCGWLVVGSR